MRTIFYYLPFLSTSRIIAKTALRASLQKNRKTLFLQMINHSGCTSCRFFLSSTFFSAHFHRRSQKANIARKNGVFLFLMRELHNAFGGEGKKRRGGGEKFIGLNEAQKMQIHAVFSPRHLNRARMMMMRPSSPSREILMCAAFRVITIFSQWQLHINQY